MIPRSQHFGDPAPFPFNRPGIMRVFEKAAFKAFLLTARRRAHYPGKQPNASVEQGESGRLAAGQHIVADRDRDDRPRLEQPLVDPLEAAAQDGDAGARGELAHQGLGRAARRAGVITSFGAGRPARCRAPRRARRRASPSPPRRRPACRRPSGACRSRNRGSGPCRATRSPRASARPARLRPSGPGNISG